MRRLRPIKATLPVKDDSGIDSRVDSGKDVCEEEDDGGLGFSENDETLEDEMDE